MPLSMGWTWSRLSDYKNQTPFSARVGEGWDGYEWTVGRTTDPRLEGVRPGWSARSRVNGGAVDVDFAAPGSAPNVSMRGVRLGRIGRLVALGANRFAGLVVPRAKPSLAAASGGCDETAAFDAHCAEQAAAMRQHLRASQYARGLVFEVPGVSRWGVGNLLSLAFLVHEWCVRTRRFCYLQLWDSELGTLFGYRDGQSWHPEPAELARYPGQALRLRVSHKSLGELFGLIEEHPDVPLLHVVQGAMAEDWFSSEYFLQALDRCVNHFVTSPRFPLPSLAPAPTHVFHFRTFFADVRDPLVTTGAGNASETRRWFDAALCDAALFRALGPRALVLSDSVGWSRFFQRDLGLQHVARADATQASRSWNVERPQKIAAAVDIYAAGLATEMYVSSGSRFPGPAIARSVCLRSVRSVRDFSCRLFEASVPRNFPSFIDPMRYGVDRREHEAVSELMRSNQSKPLTRAQELVAMQTILGQSRGKRYQEVRERYRHDLQKRLPAIHRCAGSPPGECLSRYLQAFS